MQAWLLDVCEGGLAIVFLFIYLLIKSYMEHKKHR